MHERQAVLPLLRQNYLYTVDVGKLICNANASLIEGFSFWFSALYFNNSSNHRHRKGGERTLPSPGFWKFQQKKVILLILREKNKFYHFWPPLENFWKNPLVAPVWKKSFRRPSLQCVLFTYL